MPPPDTMPTIGNGGLPGPGRGGRRLVSGFGRVFKKHLWASSAILTVVIIIGLVVFFQTRADDSAGDKNQVSNTNNTEPQLGDAAGSKILAKSDKSTDTKKSTSQTESNTGTTSTSKEQSTTQDISGTSTSTNSTTDSKPPAKSTGGTTSGDSSSGGSGTSNSSTDFCSKFPALPTSKPSTDNTGVPAGTSLKSVGSITAATPGEVIEAVNVSDGITVKADNVTIKSSKITTSGYYGINIASGVTGTKILHNEIYTANGGYTGVSGNGNGETICGNYIHGWENGMTLTGGGMMVQANLIQKLQSNQSGPHYDGIELYAGSGNQFWGNNIRMTDKNGNWLGETGAINVTGQYSAVNDTVIHGNWLGGGSYTLNLDDGQGYAVNNLTITDNHFYGSSPTGYAAYGPVRESSLATTWSGNVWTDSGLSVAK